MIGPALRNRPRKDRLLEADPWQAARGRALKVCTPITMMGRGVATVDPATPESRNTHGYSTPYGTPITHPAWHCCHVDHDALHDGLQVRLVDGGPLRSERRPKAAWPPPVGLRHGRLPMVGLLPSSGRAHH